MTHATVATPPTPRLPARCRAADGCRQFTLNCDVSGAQSVAGSLALLFGTVWLRASLPRMRYDQLMSLGWKYLIEIAILWVMVSATIVVATAWSEVSTSKTSPSFSYQ